MSAKSKKPQPESKSLPKKAAVKRKPKVEEVELEVKTKAKVKSVKAKPEVEAPEKATTKKKVKAATSKAKEVAPIEKESPAKTTVRAKVAKAKVAKKATSKKIDIKKEEVTSWYDYPEYYDLGFQDNNKLEVKFFQEVFKKLIPGTVKKVLEPGCGTGRLIYEMAKKGFEMTGLDLNANALEFARARLHKHGLDANLVIGNMADFDLPIQFDAAFNTINTFRHLTSEDDAVKHLKLIAKHLRPGGIYILGFHLLPPDCDPYGTERWKVKKGKTDATFSLKVMESSYKTRLELLKITMTIRKPSGTLRLQDAFHLRLYNAAQVKSLFAKVPELKLAGIYDFWYEMEEPQKLDNEIVDAVFLLQKQ